MAITSFFRSSSPSAEASPIRSVRDEQGMLLSGSEYVAGVDVHFTERIPENVDDTLGTMVVTPGYYGLKWTYGDFRDELAALTGRRVRTYRHGRFEDTVDLLFHPDNILHPDKLGKRSAVRMIDSVCKANPSAPPIVIGHSMGGPHAVDATLRRMDDVEGVVLFGSAGLEEGQNTVRLGLRIPGVIKNEIVPGVVDLAGRRKDRKKLLGEAVMHGLGHPWRLIGEALDVSNRPFMDRELTLLNAAGIGIYVIHLEHDGFFPFEYSSLQAAGRLARRVEIVSGANHLLPQLDPALAASSVRDILKPKLYLANTPVLAEPNEPQVALATGS